MKLDHIEIDNLKITTLNVRKIGKKDIADILPSIRSLGVLQPLLVRQNCEGYDIVAGQRRYHAAKHLAHEASEKGDTYEPLPCIIMEEGDDAKAIEASLAENIARLPMDEIDQFKAFAALAKQGLEIDDIANRFGVTTRLVKQRMAIANLHSPILTACRKGDIRFDTIRNLTLATTSQQKAWWKLYSSDEGHAPTGSALKSWLFGGGEIPTSHALFDVNAYGGNIIADLFGDEQYFDDAAQFWELQNAAIAERSDTYLANGWSEVIIGDVGAYWQSWSYQKTTKKDGGKIYISIASDGEVAFHEGYLSEAEISEAAKAKAGGDDETSSKPQTAELTKAMQNYLGLHRHCAVRSELLKNPDIALRLGIAQVIAGSPLWDVSAEPQKANSEAIKQSVSSNGWNVAFDKTRHDIESQLGMEKSKDEDEAPTLVPRKSDWQRRVDVGDIFAALTKLDNKDVTRILTFVVAETLAVEPSLVEGLGNLMKVDMTAHWKLDETFFDLLRDKQAINACLKEVAGKNTSDAHVSSTAKVQKKIIKDCLDGTRANGKTDWQPRYMAFPMKAYTKRGGIDAIDAYKAVKKNFG